ncbi:unnamed protein product [Cochlearia groenlandica]
MKRKEFISEVDIATILQRYDTMTILKLLQEMAYYAGPKMDWDELVKKTSTGINSAREYQLLWRHLAYRDSLVHVEDDAQALDDDSDMECELEASPAVNVDAVTEVAAHVKVMASSYIPSDSDIPEDSTMEAPLTINIPYSPHRGPKEPSDSYWSSRGMNITFPVSLQKAAEGLNGNGLVSSLAPRKRRKKWSPEEDEELIAAVRRHGEGSWVLISKEEFEGERRPSQLSQHWAAIRKRCDTLKPSTQSGQQRTEAQLAANRALTLALGNRAPSKKLVAGTSIAPMLPSGNGARNGSSLQGQQSQPVVQALPRAATSVPAAKSRTTTKKTTASSTSRAELMVTANSVAAAACMPGLATTSSMPKVEPGKNSVAVLVPKIEPVKNTSVPSLPYPSGVSSALNSEPVKSTSAVSLPRPSSIISAPKAGPVKPASAVSLPSPSGVSSSPNAEPVKTTSIVPLSRPSGIVFEPKAGPIKTGAPVPLPRPSSTLSAPKTEPVKSASASASASNNQVVGPLNIRTTVNGNQKPAVSSSPSNKPSLVAPLPKGATFQYSSVPPTFASSRLVPIQRIPPATVMLQKPRSGVAVTASTKPVGVQKEQAQGNKASLLVTPTLQQNKTIQTNSAISTGKLVAMEVETPPSLTPKKTQVLPGSCADKSPVTKPPEEESTKVSPPVRAETASKPKDVSK